MDKTRFLQYARYDLTLNRTFYRNMAFTTAVVIVSIALLGFLLRWILWKNVTSVTGGIGRPDESLSGVGGTCFFLYLAATCFLCLFAGCLNHPLRNKQSRISVLSLPATNAEKFVWHLLLVVGGGLLLCLVSLLLADAVNFIFSFIVGFPPHQIHSLTLTTLRLSVLDIDINGSFSAMDGLPYPPDSLWNHLLTPVAWVSMALVGAAWNIAVFIFGNSLKWRMNIPWTILALWVLQTLASILLVAGAVGLAAFADDWPWAESHFSLLTWCGYAIYMLFFGGTAVWMFRMSWQLYQKAQLTNRLNH